MKYRIELSKKVSNFLKSKDYNFLKKINKIFEKISVNPFDKSLDIKKLKGFEKSYRLRTAKYRFLYEIREKEILIFFYKADSRGDIYKN